MENVNRKTEYPCSGCGGCIAVCSRNAIRLEMDAAGLLNAIVDESLCVNCGACIQVCQRFSETINGKNLRNAELYAVQSADPDTVKLCSSGGLAHELSIDAVKKGMKAVGAVYDTKTDRVFHKIVCCVEDVKELDGSKYLQSDPQHALSEAVAEARRDPNSRFIVFGTPCQISGLAKACDFMRIRDQFLLVEIFCHGVPPYRLWERQTERMRKKLGTDCFENLSFRYKKDDWHSYCIKAEANGKTFYGSRERELFWQVYFENVLLGDACMTCRLRQEISQADMRIGDYWGRRYQSRSDGVSAAFVCSERGKQTILHLLKEGRLIAFDPGTPEEMLRAQNMEGYSRLELHDDSIRLLRDGASITKAVRAYRIREPIKSRLKRSLLRISGALPDKLRAKLRKIRR